MIACGAVVEPRSHDVDTMTYTTPLMRPLVMKPKENVVMIQGPTHRLHSSSFLGFITGNPKKELLWSLWVQKPFETEGLITDGHSTQTGILTTKLMWESTRQRPWTPSPKPETLIPPQPTKSPNPKTQSLNTEKPAQTPPGDWDSSFALLPEGCRPTKRLHLGCKPYNPEPSTTHL